MCRHKIELLDPTNTVGGRVRLRFRVTAPHDCFMMDGTSYRMSVGVEEKEVTGAHVVPDGWNPVGSATLEPNSMTTDNWGITTGVFYMDWDTTDVHNGTHRIRVTTDHALIPFLIGINDIEEFPVSIKNLTITSVTVDQPDTPKVICWNGVDSAPVTVNLDDNDPTDPITLVFRDFSPEK